DHFMDSSLLDLEASLTAPMAEARGGFIQASFDYPGQFVGPDDDFVWDEPVGEIRTNGNFVISDSNNRTFTVSNGVLYVDDFLLMAGANLRGRGDNPLIIYAQGKVEIYGKLSVSGNDSHWPTSLNSPGFPEGPVLGECGGGLGGISSFEGLKETLRGKPGDGPFGFVGIGGQGGEGGFQQNGVGSSATETAHLIAGGGAGGGFTRTSNVAIWRQDWISNQRPNGADNNGPDHRHTEWNLWPDGYWRGPVERLDPNDPFHERHRPDLNAYGPAELPVYGAEPGVRGASFKTPMAANYDYDAPPPTAHGVHGMEDERVDLVDPLDSTNASSFDPDWFINEVPDPDPSIQNPRTFDLGHPTNGADGGLAGQPVFSDDGDTRDDFYGTRLNNDGTVTQGELFSGWAGSGGGASGDSQMIRRISTAVPLRDYFPTRPFPPTGSGYYYRKGAPGGGGGGQLQILAIGPVILGSSSSIESNGGIGHGGESTIYTQGQISGSGGGAGGHIVIHSATAIDLSLIDVGNATTATDVFNLNQKTVVEAIGGRRGWSGSWNSRIGSTNTYDGNGDQMVGRGGAGANGLIQFHVPDPNTDYFWNTWSRNGILAFIAPTGAVDTDRLEMILDLYASPKPYALLPFFAAKSQMQSIWLDTGMAFVHRESLGDYPQWSNPMLAFDGVDTTTGAINVSGGEIIDLPDLVTGTTSQASFTLNTISVLDASVRFAGLEHFLRHPMALVGYTVLPNVLDALEAVVIDASYDASADILLLTTDINDGALSAGAVAGEDWSIRPRFFTVRTTGDRDGLPTNAGINIVFQGTDDPENGQILPGAVEWTANMADLDGLRFIRYRVTFDIDATGAGVSPTSPRPEMDYLKIPFVW
ncbi:MAG: hypothetical protein MK213_07100, partial [Planctomycetes bacterium]|nr:hypothetical protein [Planctomycetota bacterium]